ncbi:MAG: hypothetical protein P4M11_06925 [Candidatus Pacebacteria bacterium]|nr:hypothetical protein [Candidatus Paceibacterota bacterium]
MRGIELMSVLKSTNIGGQVKGFLKGSSLFSVVENLTNIKKKRKTPKLEGEVEKQKVGFGELLSLIFKTD